MGKMEELNAKRLLPGDYERLLASLRKLPLAEQTAAMRHLCRTDLWFLLRWICKRSDMEEGRTPTSLTWLWSRVREVEANPNGRLDLWARYHYKSSIITFGKTLQDILASHGDAPLLPQEITVGIFSHTRPIAKSFLRTLKVELERNDKLKELFPDVLYARPQVESPKWSEDEGLIVKRSGNPKEATLEAWGLVDGMPTGKHFGLRMYDDVVTEKSVTSPEMIEKTSHAFNLSSNLGMPGGVVRAAGTRYDLKDSYGDMIARGILIERRYAATQDGTDSGLPVFLSKEQLAQARKDQGPSVFAAQMLLDPRGDGANAFKREWVEYWDAARPRARDGLNVYILVDPASSKKASSDYTAMWVIGLGADKCYYVLDLIRDKLSLRERGDTLLRLVRKWKPLSVGYEQYGLQADIEYLRERQQDEKCRFLIIPLKGALSKKDRINRLLPIFEQGRVLLPQSVPYTDYENRTRDLVTSFVEEEFLGWPVPLHDDLLDALARILDEDLRCVWPGSGPVEYDGPSYGRRRFRKPRDTTTWMSA